jgi:hypothetical protein
MSGRLTLSRSLHQHWRCGLAAIGSAVLLLAGCGHSSPTTRLPSPTPRQTPTLSPVEATVLQAYRAGWAAFDQAIAIPDPAYPGLEATTTGPLLVQLRKNLVIDQMNGFVGSGPTQILHPRLTSVTDGTAVVIDCVYSGPLIVKKTGQPVPGDLGLAGYAGVRATLVMTAPGVWKTSDLYLKEGSTCPLGY